MITQKRTYFSPCIGLFHDDSHVLVIRRKCCLLHWIYRHCRFTIISYYPRNWPNRHICQLFNSFFCSSIWVLRAHVASPWSPYKATILPPWLGLAHVNETLILTFSLTTNQRIIFLAIAYQQSERSGILFVEVVCMCCILLFVSQESLSHVVVAAALGHSQYKLYHRV